jgi:hypothetical protein
MPRAGTIVTAVVGPAGVDMATRLESDDVVNYRQQNVLMK